MNVLISPILAVGLGELVTTLVLLASLGIWVMSQIADAKKKQQGQPPRRPPGPRPDQPAMAGGQQPKGEPLRAQVDEFLRRAGQQGQPQGARPGPPRRPPAQLEEIQVILDDEPAEPARRPLAEPLRPMGEAGAATPRQAKPPRQRPPRRAVPMRQQSVSEHVASHVDAAVEEIRREVSDLGQSVITADREFDVKMHRKFDHELGSLRAHHMESVHDRPSKPAAETPASAIAAMLASPAGVRQAIVVNEILRRPEERW